MANMMNIPKPVCPNHPNPFCQLVAGRKQCDVCGYGFVDQKPKVAKKAFAAETSGDLKGTKNS
jgi:hypothetical protein